MSDKVNKEKANDCIKNLQNVCHVCELLYGAIKNDRELTDDLLRATLGNMEHYIANLSMDLGYASVIAKDVTERSRLLVEANNQITDLRKQLTDKFKWTSEMLTIALRQMESVFRAWYEAMGFHYASLSLTEHGIHADFSAELEKKPYHHLSEKSDYDAMAGLIGDDLPAVSGVYDGMRAHFRLSDTMGNKQALIAIYQKWFPNSSITGFSSREDESEWILSHKAYVSYADLTSLLEKIRQKGGTSDA